MPQAQIKCCIETTDAQVPLGLEIRLDDQVILALDHVTESVNFEHAFLDDDDSEHVLSISMKNKLQEHTKVDEQGNIVKDACLLIKDFRMEDIDLAYTFTKLSRYTHDFNGTADILEDDFYGTMGCNGTVSLKFNTPVYLWLLEHL
jgi:hypothetical protein